MSKGPTQKLDSIRALGQRKLADRAARKPSKAELEKRVAEAVVRSDAAADRKAARKAAKKGRR